MSTLTNNCVTVNIATPLKPYAGAPFIVKPALVHKFKLDTKMSREMQLAYESYISRLVRAPNGVLMVGGSVAPLSRIRYPIEDNHLHGALPSPAVNVCFI
jgi:hypothetical protein